MYKLLCCSPLPVPSPHRDLARQSAYSQRGPSRLGWPRKQTKHVSCSGGHKVMKGCRFQTKSLIFDEPFSVFSNLDSKIAKMTPYVRFRRFSGGPSEKRLKRTSCPTSEKRLKRTSGPSTRETPQMLDTGSPDTREAPEMLESIAEMRQVPEKRLKY